MRLFLTALSDHPRLLSIIGTVTGWASFDLVRAAQFTAAFLAGLLSLCSLILIAPKVLAELRRWYHVLRS